MLPRKRAKLAFATALALMVAGGVGAAVIVVRLLKSAEWITHTYEVKLAVGKEESLLTEAARGRLSYVSSGNEAYVGTFDSANSQALADVQRIRELTNDNPTQREFCRQLDELANRRLGILKAAVDLRKSGQIDDAKQALFSRDNMAVSQDIDSLIQKMDQEEDVLLGQRVSRSSNLFVLFEVVLAEAFAVALVFFWIHYCLITNEFEPR